jgi:hypothetical protein
MAPAYNIPTPNCCRHGHAMVGDNIKIRIAKGRPVRRCVACERSGWRQTNKTGALREATVRRIVAAINEGATRVNLDGRRGDNGNAMPRIVAPSRLRLFIETNPKLGKWMTTRLDANAKTAFHNAMAKRRISAPAIIRNASEAMQLISRAVPRSFAQRDEIISLMALAYVEGQLKLADVVQAVDLYRRRADRQSEDRLVKGRYGNNSIDAQAYRDSPVPIVETISQGLWQ